MFLAQTTHTHAQTRRPGRFYFQKNKNKKTCGTVNPIASSFDIVLCIDWAASFMLRSWRSVEIESGRNPFWNAITACGHINDSPPCLWKFKKKKNYSDREREREASTEQININSTTNEEVLVVPLTQHKKQSYLCQG